MTNYSKRKENINKHEIHADMTKLATCRDQPFLKMQRSNIVLPRLYISTKEELLFSYFKPFCKVWDKNAQKETKF